MCRLKLFLAQIVRSRFELVSNERKKIPSQMFIQRNVENWTKPEHFVRLTHIAQHLNVIFSHFSSTLSLIGQPQNDTVFAFTISTYLNIFSLNVYCKSFKYRFVTPVIGQKFFFFLSFSLSLSRTNPFSYFQKRFSMEWFFSVWFLKHNGQSWFGIRFYIFL